MLCVDEMSIKANMFYNIGLDSVIGLEDVGSKKAFQPAMNATVLMVRGLHGNWKQPLAYHFVNSTCPGNMLKDIVVDAILHLNAIGLKVCVVVCDLGSNNIQMAQLLNVTAEQPFFFVCSQKIIAMFDIPRLLKALRNILLSHIFIFGDKRASWEPIKCMYNNDKM
jgi:hypothetical protein